ncbi:MAG: AzlD domain-containing protein [Spirochaetaceae bacterium]|nr:AzlD domain-containing protein [Spirochaetaceae bacterium]
MAGSVKEDLPGSIPVLIASGFTALVHLWKRNALISIFGGTLIYMVLSRLL